MLDITVNFNILTMLTPQSLLIMRVSSCTSLTSPCTSYYFHISNSNRVRNILISKKVNPTPFSSLHSIIKRRKHYTPFSTSVPHFTFQNPTPLFPPFFFYVEFHISPYKPLILLSSVVLPFSLAVWCYCLAVCCWCGGEV